MNSIKQEYDILPITEQPGPQTFCEKIGYHWNMIPNYCSVFLAGVTMLIIILSISTIIGVLYMLFLEFIYMIYEKIAHSITPQII